MISQIALAKGKVDKKTRVAPNSLNPYGGAIAKRQPESLRSSIQFKTI